MSVRYGAWNEEVVGYDYRSTRLCSACTLRALMIDGAAELELSDMDPDEALDLVEAARGVIFGDEATYGLLDFPNPVFEGDVKGMSTCEAIGRACESCGVRLTR